MKFFGAINLIYLCFIQNTLQLTNNFFQNFKQDKGVIIPSLQEFKQLKKDFEYTIVYFQQQHCQICQEFEKQYFNLASNLFTIEPELPIVKLNCSERKNKDYCMFKERIRNFPSLRIYHHNQYTDYKGRFRVKEVQDWVLERTINSIRKLEKEKLELFRNILELEEIIVLGYIKDDDQFKQKELSLTSTLFGMAHYYYTTNQDVYKKSLQICDNLKNEVHGNDSELVLIHSDHHRCYFYNEIFDHRKILKFLKSKEKASLRPFDKESIKMHNFYKLPLVILFIEDISEKVFKLFQVMADFYHDQFFFVYIDKNIKNGNYPKFTYKDEDQIHEQRSQLEVNSLISTFGTKQQNWPEVYVYRQKNEHFQDKWKFQQQFTKDNLLQFLKRVHDRQEPQFTKAESLDNVRIFNKNSEVKKLSAINFKQETQKQAILFLEGDKEMCTNCEESYKEFVKALKRFGDLESFPISVYRFNIQYNELKDWNFDRVPEIIYIQSVDELKTYDSIMKDKHIHNFLIKELQNQDIIFTSSEVQRVKQFKLQMKPTLEAHDPVDVADKHKIRSPDAMQLILTIYTFLGALFIKMRHLNCNWKWNLWIDIMLYGSMIWLAFLLITMIIRFKSFQLRRWFKYIDIFFFLFHVTMWVWLFWLYWKDEFFKQCSDPVDLFGFVYLILGAIAILMIGISILGFICGKLTPKQEVGTSLDGGLYDVGDDTDFNPYQ